MPEPTQLDTGPLVQSSNDSIVLSLDGRLYKLSISQATLLRDSLTTRLAKVKERRRVRARKEARKIAREQRSPNPDGIERFRRDVHS